MAELPSSLIPTATLVVGDDIYALGQCGGPQDCPGASRFLRYSTTEDTWRELPLLAAAGSFRLVGLGDDVVAYATTDESGAVADQLYDVAAGAWHALPDDPLPPVYDRFAVVFDGQLLLFGSPLGGGSTKVLAAFDPTAQGWEALPESGTKGFQAWRSGSEIVLNPHFGPSAEGGVYDPVGKQWSDLPEGPASETWNRDMAGVIGSDEATFEYASGWVLDSTTDTWIEIPPDQAAPPQATRRSRPSGPASSCSAASDGPDRMASCSTRSGGGTPEGCPPTAGVGGESGSR